MPVELVNETDDRVAPVGYQKSLGLNGHLVGLWAVTEDIHYSRQQ